ncbi:MAG: hypothetical protein K6F71_00875 [Ruminococcus sp.]|uniref:hypothetical protein n=1 Tax=Ruminococcus sp. TaxID=41978 RepID=UPI0025D3D0F5|nr:hypothetical protein [Ruminococcus sp.]MCR5539378.1 hypothetical protein [Ruminococcus sp.]
MKRAFLLISIVMVLCFSVITAYAHQNAQKIEIDTYHFTDDACYIDLLVKMDSDDEDYTKFNNDNMDRFDFDKTKLSEYIDEDGYISFSCHYKGIYSDMIINKKTVRDTLISENCFTLDKDLEIDLNVMKALYDKKRVFKIAILDKEGSILRISEPFEVHNEDKGYISSDVKYDISKNEVEYYWSNNYPTDSGIKIYNKPLAFGILMFFIFSISFLVCSIRRRKRK